MKIFVYGTLKRGGRAGDMLRGQQFIGEAQTIPEYMLFGNPRIYPMLYRVGPQTGVSVKGEVYDIDDRMLQRLDAYESYPSLYDRQQVELTNGETVTAYIPRKFPDPVDFPPLGDNWPVSQPVEA